MKELTMRSRLKKLRNTLSSMTLPQKLDHLWTYYKESLFAVFLVVVIIAVICTAVVQSGKETLISGIAANVYLSEELQEYLTAGYLDKTSAEANQQAYLEQIQFSAPEGYDLEGSSLESSLSVLVMAGAGNLDYLLLDWCGTSDEATAAVREEYADRFKVVWRVFAHPYNFLTDTYKVWMNDYVDDEMAKVLYYCNEIRYLDLGHNSYTHCEWVRNMPNLEALIMGDSDVASLEPLRDCKKLTFLEVFNCNVTDLSPLADCTELRYLNISYLKIDDITPLYGLDNMVKLNSTMNHIPADQVEKYKELQPRCYATFLPYGDPTDYEWRYYYNGQMNPRYLLLRHQMGYANGNVSGYPYGHVTEPITYESIGITPPEYEWQEWD